MLIYLPRGHKLKKQKIEETDNLLKLNGMSRTEKKISIVIFLIWFLATLIFGIIGRFQGNFWFAFPSCFGVLFLLVINTSRHTFIEISKDSIRFRCILNQRQIQIEKMSIKVAEFIRSNEAAGEYIRFFGQDGKIIGTISSISFDHWDKVKIWVTKHYPHRKGSSFWF